MISQLTGRVIQQTPPVLVLDVHGVGYEIQAPMTTFYRLPREPDQQVTLYTHLQVREDAHVLYGFIQPLDRRLFREVIKVNGIGPKLALAILSGMEVATFVAAIRHQDIQSLVSLPGLGKKTAERLLMDLKDKLTGWSAVSELAAPVAGEQPADALVVGLNTSVNASQVMQEAEQALVALGYRPQQARQAIAKLPTTEGADSQTLIKSALQSLVR